MRFIILAIAALILIVAGWTISHIVSAAGTFADLEPLRAGQCRKVDIAPGTEDVTIDPDANIAFVSAADRRSWYNESGASGVNPKNGIYTLALDGSDEVRKVSPAMENFLPHGISLWKGDDGEKRLFVVSHPPTGEEIVEIFSVDEDHSLTHLDSVSFEDMHSPNDVLGVGPRQFYATNDRGFEEGLMATLETYMALPFASVAYFDGTEGRIAAKGLTYANGINQSADGKTVYVAEILERRIAIFDRDPQTGEIKKRKTIKTNTGPDNIEVGPDGDLWVAGHTKVFEFLAHAKDASAIAPAHAIRVDPDTGENEDFFISTGGEINASSVAAASPDVVIIGAVFDGHVMVCPR